MLGFILLMMYAMDKMHYVINSAYSMANCLAAIANESQRHILSVTIAEHKEDRSEAQRRLQYVWYTEIAKRQGHDVRYIRDYYMRRYALTIFYRDDINGSTATIDAIKGVKAKGMIEHYEHIIKGFVKNITTNSFNVSQNKEYLDLVYMHAINQGIQLTVPEDLKYSYEAS